MIAYDTSGSTRDTGTADSGTSGSLYDWSEQDRADIDQIAETFGVAASRAFDLWQEIAALFGQAARDLADIIEQLNDSIDWCLTPKVQPALVMVGSKRVSKRRFEQSERLFSYPQLTWYSVTARLHPQTLPRIGHR